MHRAAISGCPRESYQQEHVTALAFFALSPGAYDTGRRSGTFLQLEPTGGEMGRLSGGGPKEFTLLGVPLLR